MTKNSGFPAGGVPLDRVRTGAVEWQGEIPREPGLWSAPELRFADAPQARLRLTGSGEGGFHLTGRLSARLRVDCRRCLEELVWPVEMGLDLWFEPAVGLWEEEAGVYALDADAGTLDLLRPLREELLLALPEFPVCGPDCRGLCPRCGVNLNERTCDCGAEEIDSRWAALKELPRDE
jgi:uncharacterized protein